MYFACLQEEHQSVIILWSDVRDDGSRFGSVLCFEPQSHGPRCDVHWQSEIHEAWDALFFEPQSKARISFHWRKNWKIQLWKFGMEEKGMDVWMEVEERRGPWQKDME